MAEQNVPLLAFNRGMISPLALARIDFKRTALSAEVQTNWVPRVLGSMMLRPGLMFVGATHNGAFAKYIPFLFNITDTALLELTDSTLRVLIDEVPITRAAVGTTVTNGTFNTSTGWSVSAPVGGAASFGNQLNFYSDGSTLATVSQTLNIASGDLLTLQALRVIVTQGPVHFSLGSQPGYDDVFASSALLRGTHSLAFIPGAISSIYLQFSTTSANNVEVVSVEIEPAGVLTLPTPWAASQLNNIRWAISADVIFCACQETAPQQIMRWSPHSWSVVRFQSTSGPYAIQNTTPTSITATPGNGECAITASTPIFGGIVPGTMFTATYSGNISYSAAGSSLDAVTQPVEVQGTVRALGINLTLTAAATATVILESSVGAPGAWQPVPGETWSWSGTSANVNTSYTDAYPNSIIYYRLRVSAYTSGTVTMQLVYAGASLTCVYDIQRIINQTMVYAAQISPPGTFATTSTTDWAMGQWSGPASYPSAVAMYQGRLWWAGNANVWASVSDDYSNYDPTYLGDAAPINSGIGEGIVDIIQWLVAGPLFLMGAQGSEFVIKSDALGSPIVPANVNLVSVTTHGSAGVPAIKIDQSTFFVARSGSKVYEVVSDIYATVYSLYNATEVSLIAPEVIYSPILRAAVQRNIDTRIHFVKTDGTVALFVYSKGEDVKSWIQITTDGIIEDVVVMPTGTGELEDWVYYVVNRTINGVATRSLERWAFEEECIGGILNKNVDSAIIGTNTPASATLSGLARLNGASVVCWADGVYQGAYTVAGGGITLAVPVTSWIVGLPYQAVFQSTKLAYAARDGTALTQRGRVDQLGFILANTHYQGLQYGPDLNNLDNLPLNEMEETTPANTIWTAYDFDAMEFNDTYNTDSRICLVANAPLPVTVLAAIVSVSKYDKK